LLYSIIKVCLFNKQIYINQDSFLLLAIRVVSEILQSYFTILAIKNADRSTFSFIRTLTIPLLLIIDLIIGYKFSFISIIGLWILIISFFIIFLLKNKINFKWWKYVLFTAINWAFTISLFKYSITFYWNSVEFDQIVVFSSVMFFYLYYLLKYKYKIPNIFKDKLFLFQGISMGVAMVLISFSYLFLNSSIATAIKRWWEIFWSIIFWYKIFNEKNILFKFFIAIFIFIWLILSIL